VIGKQSAGLYTDLIGSGKEWGVSVTFKIQEEAGGIAQALYLAEPFITPGEKFVVLLGDNLFEDHLSTFVQAYEKQAAGARVLLKKVLDPKRYGVPVLEKDNIVMIEEKPEDPKSDYCVTGIYMYDSTVFETIRTIKPSARGELEITDVNKAYLDDSSLTVEMLGRGFAWLDTGTHESLLEASHFVHTIEQRQGLKVACLEEIAFNSGWITPERLDEQAEKLKKTGYGQYLKKLLAEAYGK